LLLGVLMARVGSRRYTMIEMIRSRRDVLKIGAAAAGAMLLQGVPAMAEPKAAKRVVVVWSEGTAPKKVYPKDINGAIAEGLAPLEGWEVVTASLEQPQQGLPDDLLNRTDVLIWWGHQRHGQVNDALVEKIVKRVKENGMGFISLHSSHFAKPNKALMGTACSWKNYLGDITETTVVAKDPSHPIAQGLSDFTIANSERYVDPYVVPPAKALVFEGTSKLTNGGTDKSQFGFTWEVGKGKVFYFQGGHETNPIFLDASVRKMMLNAVRWAAPDNK
jgi:trehalose utilization protein